MVFPTKLNRAGGGAAFPLCILTCLRAYSLVCGRCLCSLLYQGLQAPEALIVSVLFCTQCMQHYYLHIPMFLFLFMFFSLHCRKFPLGTDTRIILIINKELTFMWLKSRTLKPSTEGMIMAAQDQSLKTKIYQHAIMKSIARTDDYYYYYYYEMTQRQCAYRGVHLIERTVDVDVCTKRSRD